MTPQAAVLGPVEEEAEDSPVPSFEIHGSDHRCRSIDTNLRARIYRTRDWLSTSEWAERHLWLSPEDTGELTKYRGSLTPWHKEPMDALGDLTVRRVVLMWASQTGKTTVFKADIGSRMHQRPSPMLMVMPRVEDAELWSKERLEPMLRDTPALAGITSELTRDKRNTIRRKAFPGGYLGMVGANAPAGLAMRSVPIVRADEVDRMPDSAGDEGDPLAIIERRMATFPFRSMGICSSPTNRGSSRIEREFLLTDQRHWYVPCPHCDVPQVLRKGGRDDPYGLKWLDGKPETVVYLCAHCGKTFDEKHKRAMNAAGEWVAHHPENADRGYWLNALVSMFDGARWPLLVTEWLRKKSDPMQLKSFVNTVLAETWQEDGVHAEEEQLLNRLETYAAPVPARAAILMRAVDVQDDRLETAVWAFGADEESWLVDYDYIPGDPATPLPWSGLTKVRTKTYRHESGHILAPQATFIDSGGHHTNAVYRYAKRHLRERVWAIKGMEGEGAPILGKPSRKNAAKVTLYLINTFSGKETFVQRLIRTLEPGPAYVHLPDWIEADQLKQLGNEQLVRRTINGRVRRMWVRRGANEMLDMAVYCLAALQMIGEKEIAKLGEVAQWMMDNPPSGADSPAAAPVVQRSRRVRSQGISV